MNKKAKRIIVVAGVVLSAFLVTGCTASFCSNKDLANIMTVYDPGIDKYYSDNPEGDRFLLPGNDHVYVDTDIISNPALVTMYTTAEKDGIVTPIEEFWHYLDYYALQEAVVYYNNDHQAAPIAFSDMTADDINNKILYKLQDDNETRYVNYAYAKFYGNSQTLWENWDKWTSEIKLKLGPDNCPNADFTKLYKNTVNGYVNSVRSCISVNGGYYGHFGASDDKTQVYIEAKDWGYAWSRGFIECILVYPVAYLVDYFSTVFGVGGWGQVGAILLVTLIVRLILLLITFKATISQTKMQALQPELARIQAKYPNSKTNQYEKQRLAQEQMALYKKNKVSVFAPFLTLIIQFPIFIAVWGAMTGSAILSSDAILGLRLSDSIGNTIINFAGWPGNPGWWTAIVLLLLMAGGQFVSAKLPNWLQKSKMKKLAKLGKNPAQTQQSKQMKWMGNIMLVVIIIMGVTLPAAMGVYWFAGALITIAQSVIIHLVTTRKDKTKKRG